MEGWKHSSGHKSPGRSKSFSGILKARKYIIAFVMLLLLAMPGKIYAAELNVPGAETDTEGDIDGTLDSQSNYSESDSDTISDTPETVESDDTVSGGDASGTFTRDEVISLLEASSANDASEDYFPLYESYEEFMESPLYVTRYENEVLKKLEFMQYAQAIMIALLFLLIFRKK